MPLPPRRRIADKRATLILMVESVGDDRPCNRSSFSRWTPGFEDFESTTWRELADAYLIEERGEKPGPTYRLTPLGWITGLEWSGALVEGSDVHQRAIAIRCVLKAKVNRQQSFDFPIHVRDLAKEVGLPVGWVWSAMSANLLQKMFPNHLMNARFDGHLIKVPPTFDMKDE